MVTRGQNDHPDGGYNHFHESGQKSPHGGKLVDHVPTAAAGHGKNGVAPPSEPGRRQSPPKREIPSGVKPPPMNSDSMDESPIIGMKGQSMLGWNQE